MRDFYGYTPIAVNQFNRALSNPAFLKIESVEPTLEDLKETGNTAEAADVVITLFEPLRHRTSDPKYKAEKFVSPITGSNYFRIMKIVKNSYGEDSVRAGLAFMGSTGIFAELPKSTDMEGFEYDELFNNNYFLKQ